MGIVDKKGGKLPAYMGDWSATYNDGHGYMVKNRVTIFGSEVESLIDNNTYVPATRNEQTGVVTFDEHWKVISNGSQAYAAALAAENKMAELEEEWDDQDQRMTQMQATINAKQLEVGAVQTDEVPTENSGNHMTSGDIYQTLKNPNKGFVDNTQTFTATNLATSGAVASHGSAFDISEYKKNGDALATYATLADALAAVPASVQRGGMSIKYVQSSDNKYVQYRLMSDEFTTDITQWAIADEGVYVENPEFVYVKTDKEGKILWAIKIDGGIYYGAGCPTQVKDYIDEKLAELSLDEYEDIVAFLNDYLGSDTTLKVIIDGINAQIANKLDAEGLDIDALNSVQAIESSEWLSVSTDNDGRILEGLKADGTKVFKGKVEADSITFNEDYFNEDIFIPILTNLNRAKIDGGSVSSIKPTTLLLYTDIHRDIDRNNRVLSFIDRYKEYIKDSLILGDITGYKWETNPPEAFYHAQGMLDVLKLIGNHDIYLLDQGVTQQQIYNRYLENIENWGVVQPTGASNSGLCYYYKDYTISNLRLICLDYSCFSVGGVEWNWFQEVLSDALDKGLSVICAQHVAFNSSHVLFDTTFNTIDFPYDITMGENEAPLGLVDNFIQSGGDFVCWLFGHIHADVIGKYTEHNNQVFLVLGAAMINGQDWEDCARVIGTKSEDYFSLISFDTNSKTISMYRVGAQYDRYLRHKESLTINYKDKELLGSF